MDSPPAKRNPYQSRIRAEQAAATCALVLDAATRLFIERGYAGTSIDAIAEAAGVGRSTVFAAAGGKPWLLKTACDRAIVGDDEQVPLLERPEARKLFAMTDPTEIVTAYAGILSDAVQRVSAIYEVVRSAAGVDAEIHELWLEMSRQRLAGAESIANLLRRKGGLRKGLSAGRARDIIWIYNDPGLHHSLVGIRKWRQNNYREWLTEALKGQLVG
ncbi:TetR/AcrR family transcriptional regulator [Mycobacterium stomatepiae]|uniref:DNA-binding protein n=1 Tax=Mycobacterium stomatepiae TaxID=470076 RepID=A0A7I7Q0J4_9MYCO|nr:TetR/AcrR family transcriptional regulator [Mycobacterium stomatepiae]MCV7166179.1 TetR/AcrR family transcriptional regulator [Mycobacterium stomatepiae]BBY19833.1 DNA-binding protein [Mycobacterium stomatepiae]